MSDRNELDETEAAKAAEEQQRYFDHSALVGLPETVTHQEMVDRCGRLWKQGGETHE